jgi:hypothetical protein
VNVPIVRVGRDSAYRRGAYAEYCTIQRQNTNMRHDIQI